MYRSGLVPRQLLWLALVGGPFNILSGTLVMFGVAGPGERVDVTPAVSPA